MILATVLGYSSGGDAVVQVLFVLVPLYVSRVVGRFRAGACRWSCSTLSVCPFFCVSFIAGVVCCWDPSDLLLGWQVLLLYACVNHIAGNGQLVCLTEDAVWLLHSVGGCNAIGKLKVPWTPLGQLKPCNRLILQDEQPVSQAQSKRHYAGELNHDARPCSCSLPGMH